MSKPRIHRDTPKEPKEDDPRVDISTADDINVDEDNSVGSPKEGLTAEAPEDPESAEPEH